MTNTITINNQKVQVKQYKGQRVVTFKDIDFVHNRVDGTAKRNFKTNKNHFIEGVDFYKICQDEIRTNKIQGISNKCHQDVVLLTESGYLMLVKSFTDDLSWSVQRQLVNCYFNCKEVKQTEPTKYEYFDKTYNGVPVLSTMDVEHFTGIVKNTVNWYARNYLKENEDFYFVKGGSLRKYKDENPQVHRRVNSLHLFTKSGFLKICKMYGIKIETPQCFESKPVQLELKEDKSDGSISEILNKAQAREIFDKECVLLFGENVILYATVAKLFGKEAAESSKSDSFAKRPSGSPVGGYNRMGSKNYDFAFFYLEGFYRAVTYSDAKKIRKNLYNVNI